MLYAVTDELQKFLNNFYTLTGIKVAISDSDATFGVMSRSNDLCDRMQAHPQFHNACMNCDARALSECRKEKKSLLYRCHVGFYEYITPVFYEDVLVGFFATGMITDGSQEEHDMLKTNLGKYGVDETEFEQFYQSLSHFSREQIAAACDILEACVSHIYHRKMVKLRYLDQMQQIDHFISSNLAADLSINRLCKEFNMNRSELYKQFGSYCGMGIADYIKKKRLSTACVMIRTTDLTITRIASSVGYADYNYFSKAFRYVYGVTPREYRKKHALLKAPKLT